MLNTAAAEYTQLEARGNRFDADLTADLTRTAGEHYAWLCTLAYRQAIAAHKLVADAQGRPMLFAKENFSNGDTATVDVLYPSAPLFLFFNPKLLEAHGAIEHKLKPDKSIVTAMDLMVEEHLRDVLAALSPEVGFAGEETGADYNQATFWLVDPIDGTEPFTRGLPFATNMIALIHLGEPVMSVIYNFVLDEYFYASKVGGATKNGHTVHVSTRPLSRAFLSFGAKLKDPKQHGMRDRLRLKVQNMPQMGASGYIFSAIASGAIEGTITYGTPGGPWDFAAGALLVQEAGGRVANLGSSTYDYREIHLVATNAVVFDEVKSYIETEIAAAEK